MARPDYNAASAARQIDALVNRSRTRLYTHSPNDVLVQIALPLILILAISTRLTMVAYNMLSERDMAPAVMELWKQQIILRIDQALDAWEAEARLATFSDFSRIKFSDTWPDDADYSRLCLKARDLNDRDALQRRILAAALADQADATPGAVTTIVPGTDLQLEPGSPQAAYAVDYIAQRLARWSDRIELLHWETIGAVAQRLPLGADARGADAFAQLEAIAGELERRGYPVVATVRATHTEKE